MGILDKLKKDQSPEEGSQNTTEEKKTQKVSTKTAAKKDSSSDGQLTVTKPAVARNRQVLIQPLVTEKASVSGAYYFKVDVNTNKNEVKKAFEKVYGKKPRKVNIMNMNGKQKRFGRTLGKRADWKKAVVYLNKGETVDIFA